MQVIEKIKRRFSVCINTSNRRLSAVVKISMRLSKTRFSSSVRKFISHNKTIFSALTDTPNKDTSIVLVDVNPMSSWHIPYSYLSNIIAKENNARIVGYFTSKGRISFRNIKSHIRRALNSYPYNIYRSFGVLEFIQAIPKRSMNRKVQEACQNVMDKLQTKQDITKLKVHGILIGDLVFDGYAREYRKPTTNTEDKDFLRYLQQSIELLFFWEDYFKRNQVCSVIIAENVYIGAIIVRLAVYKNISAYATTIEGGVYCFNKDNLFNYSEWSNFPEEFDSLPETVRKAGLKEAKRRIDERFSGAKDSDMLHETSSAFSDSLYQKTRLIRKSDRTKVLIFSHCFFDAPHFYGDTIFPDFYEWLYFLGDMSEKTNYDWYIKTHPDELPGNMEIIQKFLSIYPGITLLSAKSSHHQIVNEGVDVVLTVYGTVGFEYAALGIPVVNCSLNNPHARYDFNLHPANVGEYTKIISHLDTLSIDIDMDQIYEHYFMSKIYYNRTGIFLNYSHFIESLGGYYNQFTPKAYDYWLSDFSNEKHNQILDFLKSYVSSGEYCARIKTDYG